MAVTPNGLHAMSGSSDMTLKVWDLRMGTCTTTLSGHFGWVRCMAITPESRHVVSGSNDMTLKVWDLRTGTCAATLSGHSSQVRGVAITPDGRHAVSVSCMDLNVWELGSGVCTSSIFTCGNHGWFSSSVCVTPDGRRVLYCGSSRSVVKVASLAEWREGGRVGM